jgi:hypothetical protein
MRKYFFAIAFIACSTILSAQDSSAVFIYKDARIDLLVRRQIAINEETTRDARRNVAGFRLQVLNTSDRNAVQTAKARVYQLFPELKAYLIYQSPYFRLRVGNFKDRDEANGYRKQLAAEFPAGISIVSDIIEVKPEKLAVEN